MQISKKRPYLFFLIILLVYISSTNLLFAQNKKPVKVTLSLNWLTQCQFAGYYAALENGYYLEEGIDLNIKPGAADINSIYLVESGTADFGVKWLSDFFNSRDKGLKIVSIAQILQSNGLIMISKKSSGIKTPYDFINKKIGIWLFNNETQFYALMKNLGIPLESMEIFALSWDIEPFINDKYDVVMAMTFNEYLRVLDSGYSKDEINIIDFKDYGFNFPGQVLFTKQATLDKDPLLCEKMVRASLKGWKWAMENQEKAVDIVLKYDRTGLLKKEHQIRQMKEITNLIKYRNIPLGYHSPELTSKLIKNLYDNKIISNPADLKKSYTNSFIKTIK